MLRSEGFIAIPLDVAETGDRVPEGQAVSEDDGIRTLKALLLAFCVEIERTQGIVVPVDIVMQVVIRVRCVGLQATPLASAVTLSLQLFVPEEMGRHVTLAGINRRGQLIWLGGSYADGRLTARIRTSGDWLAVADTLPPTIRPLFESGADLARKGALRFRLGDNFSGIASCDLYVDGEWTPCERYPMQGTLEYHFPKGPDGSTHRLLLVVRDGCGNESRWEGSFRR